MICSICQQHTLKSGTTTHTLHRDKTILIIKSVPALIYRSCGAVFFDAVISDQLLS